MIRNNNSLVPYDHFEELYTRTFGLLLYNNTPAVVNAIGDLLDVL
ncbi:MAG: hypothetical protein ABSA26_14010 [Thermoguttaceae bacterium]|jgi:hypothetical protein